MGLYVYMAYHSVVQHHVSLSRDRTSLQNEINSRWLYKKWRPELKREIARCWQQGLQGGAGAPWLAKDVDGLLPSFLAAPFAAAQVLAESALLRQEAHWVGLLDQSEPNADLAKRCRSRGLLRSVDDACFTLCSSVVQVLIDSPNGLNGFYISGQQSNPPVGVQTQVTITVNGIQEKTFTLGAERHFNFGISHPVVLPGVTNCIEVAFACAAPINPCSFITLAHLVIGGQVVSHLAGA